MARTRIAILCFVVGASAASAQAAAPLEPGMRVRVTVRPSAVQIARFASLTSTELLLTARDSTRVIPLATIERLEASQGRSPGVLAGVVGALVFSGIGGVVACTANRDSYGVFCAGQDDTKIVIGAVLGGLVGGTLGAVLFRRDRWVVVDLTRLRSPDF